MGQSVPNRSVFSSRFASGIDWLRRLDFIFQKWPYIAAAAALMSGIIISITDLFQRLPIVGSFLSATGAGAIVLALGIALRSHRASGGSSAQTSPQADSTPSTPLGPPDEWLEQARRLTELAERQREHWPEYIGAHIRAIDYDGIQENEPYIVLTAVLVNRSIFELAASEFAISNPRFWQTPETYGAQSKVSGSLRPLQEGRGGQKIPPGEEGAFRHEFYLSPETTTMLRDLRTQRAEVQYRMALNWRLRFADRDIRWGAPGLFSERPKQSYERQW